MKRHDVEAHLESHGCRFAKEGSRHTVFLNPLNNKTSTVPRHREVKRGLVFKTCRDLDIPPPENL
jgi:mRNA interferase HicA